MIFRHLSKNTLAEIKLFNSKHIYKRIWIAFSSYNAFLLVALSLFFILFWKSLSLISYILHFQNRRNVEAFSYLFSDNLMHNLYNKAKSFMWKKYTNVQHMVLFNWNCVYLFIFSHRLKLWKNFLHLHCFDFLCDEIISCSISFAHLFGIILLWKF